MKRHPSPVEKDATKLFVPVYVCVCVCVTQPQLCAAFICRTMLGSRPLSDCTMQKGPCIVVCVFLLVCLFVSIYNNIYILLYYLYSILKILKRLVNKFLFSSTVHNVQFLTLKTLRL